MAKVIINVLRCAHMVLLIMRVPGERLTPAHLQVILYVSLLLSINKCTAGGNDSVVAC